MLQPLFLHRLCDGPELDWKRIGRIAAGGNVKGLGWIDAPQAPSPFATDIPLYLQTIRPGSGSRSVKAARLGNLPLHAERKAGAV
jgi:hypothetical protein